MSKIEVQRSLHVERSSPSENAQVRDISYVSRDKNALIESLSIGRSGVIRRSEDNGRTWRKVEDWVTEEPLEGGMTLVREFPLHFLDVENGLLLRIFYTGRNDPKILPWDYERTPLARSCRSYVQVSKDEGLTWTDHEQIITHGEEYDEIHWLDGVYYGKNGAVVSGVHIMKNRKGEVLAPCYYPRLFGDDIINREIPRERASPDGRVEHVAGCLIGRWRSDGSGLDWSRSSLVTLPQKYSCDGADEPSCDYLPDGRMLMVLRARTYPHTGQEVPSLHYYSISDDHGKTWSECRPLLYDDDSWAYSPSCLANVFRSSKNGRSYVITNFADVPPVNCDPRNKLQIAEIDTDTMRIRRDTMTIIEQRNEVAGEPELIRFSNFAWFEDRETGSVVLYLTPGSADSRPESVAGVIANSYRYDIRLPDQSVEPAILQSNRGES